MLLTRCKICRGIVWDWELKPHTCPPCYELIVHLEDDPSHGEIEQLVYEYGGHSAVVENYAAKWDKGDYTLLDGGELLVDIRLQGEEEWRRFRVTGERIPSYQAEEYVG